MAVTAFCRPLRSPFIAEQLVPGQGPAPWRRRSRRRGLRAPGRGWGEGGDKPCGDSAAAPRSTWAGATVDPALGCSPAGPSPASPWVPDHLSPCRSPFFAFHRQFAVHSLGLSADSASFLCLATLWPVGQFFSGLLAVLWSPTSKPLSSLHLTLGLLFFITHLQPPCGPSLSSLSLSLFCSSHPAFPLEPFPLGLFFFVASSFTPSPLSPHTLLFPSPLILIFLVHPFLRLRLVLKQAEMS